MAKPKLKRITEPDEGLVHYGAVGIQDAVTLCGLTDFIGATSGKATTEKVTCQGCIDLVTSVHQHAAPAAGDHAA